MRTGEVFTEKTEELTFSYVDDELFEHLSPVVSQLSAIVCGFVLKLHGGLEDPEFLQQLHSVGVLVQFEGLLSTYGTEAEGTYSTVVSV